MKVSREKLFVLNMFLDRIKQEETKKNVFFLYSIAKNKELIKSELTALEEARKPSEKKQEYEAKRIELCKKYCKKEESGNPIILDLGLPTARFDFDIEEKNKFDEEMVPLQEEYKEILEEEKIQMEEFNNLLKEEIEVNLIKFQLSKLPESMTGNDFDILYELDLIKE